MKIIAGTIKRKKLKSPLIEDLTIRPTAQKAREALFSIIQQSSKESFLDLFSGTGAIAIEAWSRGYKNVTCVDNNSRALSCIYKNTAGTSIKILNNDINILSSNSFQNQSIIFADPPYKMSYNFWLKLAPLIKDWLNPKYGLLIWETDINTNLSFHKLLQVDKRKYGNNAFHIFTIL